MNKFYVYIYLDPRKEGKYIYEDLCFFNEPFYVGKGKGYRCNVGLKYKNDKKSKLKFDRIQSIINDNNKVICIKIYENLYEEEAYRLEIELIRKMGRISNGGVLCNSNDGGCGGNGYKHSIDWKKFLSKPVLQYSLNGDFISEYVSIKEASESTGIHKQNIGACVNGKYKKSGGFIWKYKYEECKLQAHLKENIKMPKHSDLTKMKLRKKRSDKTIEKMRRLNTKEILQYDMNGNLIKEWSSISEASRFYNIGNSGIVSCLKGKIKYYKGFIWKYKD